MARIAGINIPMNKHIVIGLTHIFGVGHTTARKACEVAGVAPTTKTKDLTETEVDKLIGAARSNRWALRDTTMILVAYRHGFRSSELVDLRWDQVDFGSAVLHVRRAKRGTPSTHPILGDESRALRRLQREQEPKSPFVFTSERGSPFKLLITRR